MRSFILIFICLVLGFYPARSQVNESFLIPLVPRGYKILDYEIGDLNLDHLKRDLVLLVVNENNAQLIIGLEQNDHSYKKVQVNPRLLPKDENLKGALLKLVIKNGFFTIEQDVATSFETHDRRYTTFKYDPAQKDWFLHRFDVEHYENALEKPDREVTHLTQKDFGKIRFKEMTSFPGVFEYEPASSVLSGTLTRKMFYARPNNGENPETDEKVWVYILKPDYPVNVFATQYPDDSEVANRIVTNVQEIQVYNGDDKMNLQPWLGKKIKVKGVFQASQTAHHRTPVLMEIRSILK